MPYADPERNLEAKRSYDRKRSAAAKHGKKLTLTLLPGEPVKPADLADLPERPRCRADCASVPRPCPWVGCRYNLYLDVDRSGGLVASIDGEPGEMPIDASCALDVADREAMSQPDVAPLLGITKQAVQQIEDKALAKMRAGLLVARRKGDI